MERKWAESQNIFICVFVLVVLCCLFLGDNANAQMGQEDVPNIGESGNGNTQPGSAIWGPSSAHPDKFDWIQLNTGEWLKGDLKVLYSHRLEFDSDKLHVLEFKWKDIKQVRGHKPQSVRFEGLITVVGILTIVDEKVSILTKDGVLEFDRSKLFSITPAGTDIISAWSVKTSIGLEVRRGNSESTNYNTTVQAERRTPKSRFSIEYLGILNTTEGVETANSQRVTSYFDIFKTRKFFWRPVFGEYFRDPGTNIEGRGKVGMGVGYHFIETIKTKFSITPGLAYQYTQNVSAEAGQSKDSSTPALEVVTNYEKELARKVDLTIDYTFDIVNQESGKYLHHTVATLEIEVTHRLDLDLKIVWDRIEEPKLKNDSTMPDQDDFHFLVGIGFEF